MDRIQSSFATLTSKDFTGKRCFTCHHNTQTLMTFSDAKRQSLVSAEEFSTFKATNIDHLKSDISKDRITNSICSDKILQKILEANLDPDSTTPDQVKNLLAKSNDPELSALTLKQIEMLGEVGAIHGDISTVGSAFNALAIAEEKPSELSSEMIRYLLFKQSKDGGWTPEETRRVPSEGSRFHSTALIVSALDKLGSLDSVPENKKAYQSGVKWLLNPSIPIQDLQDTAGVMMGLAEIQHSKHLDEASRKNIKARLKTLSESLTKDQQKNGGWIQKKGMEPDAYATGLALVALQKAGMDPNDPVYQQGALYLRTTQLKNGEWFVWSRVEAQFETLYLINDPPSDGLDAETLKTARKFQAALHKAQNEETLAQGKTPEPGLKLRDLDKLRGNPHAPNRDPALVAHHRVHSQMISFMASNYATQALIPLCGNP